MFSLLKKYTELPGPVGNEERVHRAFTEDLKPYAAEVKLSNVGNVIAHFPGKGRKVIVFGHGDEICSFVMSITDDGFLRIVSFGRGDRVGYPYSLVGQKALVIGDNGDVRGVFVSTSGHLINEREREQPLEYSRILVNVGLSSAEEVAKMGIHVDSAIIWNPMTESLGRKVFGKAMDDRLAHAVMLELAKRLVGVEPTCDLYIASTVQEEVGLKGAQDLARGGFDVSLALDVGPAGDYPTMERGRMPIKLGHGPVIAYKDGGFAYNLEIIKELRATAEKNQIPFQHGVFINYGSDSSAMIAGGAKANLIAPPTRYTHSPMEIVHLDDLENTVKLLYHYVVQ